jgi:sugar/nucleoside kinase (ribokinase family)
MSEAEILTIGSLVVDHINGVQRIGGAASNVAANVSSLGTRTAILTGLSREQESSDYQSGMETRGISVYGLSKKLDLLPRCIIQMGEDGKELGYEWHGNGIEELFQNTDVDENLIKSFPLVYLAICEGIFAEKVTLAISKNQVLSYNPGSRVFEGIPLFKSVQSRANHIFLNEKEYGYLVAEGCVQKPRDLILNDNQVAVITAGNHDTTIVDSKSTRTFPVESVTSIDETGAGDSFASAFVWGRTQGYPYDRCVKLGNLLASFTVQQVGAQINSNVAKQFTIEARKRGIIQ